MSNELTNTDLGFVVRRIPKDIREIMQRQGLLLGGGFIRETIAGSPAQDIDLFGATESALRAASEYLASSRQGRCHATPNAFTVLAHPRLPVQFIARWLFSEPEALVASFDFTVCQAVIWFDPHQKTWRSLVGEGFYPDLAARRLVYTSPTREEAAGGSMLRVRKFLQRGYSIQATSLAAVIARVAAKVEWGRLRCDADPEKNAAIVIAGLLHEVDPLVVVDGLDPIDEHALVDGEPGQ